VALSWHPRSSLHPAYARVFGLSPLASLASWSILYSRTIVASIVFRSAFILSWSFLQKRTEML
jgi:hypothetical protein